MEPWVLTSFSPLGNSIPKAVLGNLKTWLAIPRHASFLALSPNFLPNTWLPQAHSSCLLFCSIFRAPLATTTQRFPGKQGRRHCWNCESQAAILTVLCLPWLGIHSSACLNSMGRQSLRDKQSGIVTPTTTLKDREAEQNERVKREPVCEREEGRVQTLYEREAGAAENWAQQSRAELQSAD